MVQFLFCLRGALPLVGTYPTLSGLLNSFFWGGDWGTYFLVALSFFLSLSGWGLYFLVSVSFSPPPGGTTPRDNDFCRKTFLFLGGGMGPYFLVFFFFFSFSAWGLHTFGFSFSQQPSQGGGGEGHDFSSLVSLSSFKISGGGMGQTYFLGFLLFFVFLSWIFCLH